MGMMRLADAAAKHSSAIVNTLVDCTEHVELLESAATAAGATNLGALVEIECGQARCGCPPASDVAMAVAKRLVESERVAFGGLHVYHGGIQHLRSSAERMSAVNGGPASPQKPQWRGCLPRALDAPPHVTGGTGTFLQDIAAGTHGEVQPGSYLLMDGDYATNGDAPQGL